MIFSKRTIRTTSIPKISKIHRGVWKLKANKRAMLRSLGGGQIKKDIKTTAANLKALKIITIIIKK